MDLGIQGRKAVVTGGSKGLGRAIAEDLVREGADVAICSRSEEDLRKTADELDKLNERGATIFAAPADVTMPEQVTTFIEDAVAALGGIDILVNNAGRATPGTFETLDDEAWQADVDVKLFAMVRCSRAVLPHMRARGEGRIVNINSVHGKSPDPRFFATSANRAACIAFTRALALELAEHNILVNSVNVGFVETPQWENIHRMRAPELSREEFFAQLAAADIPLGRFGVPGDVSAVVAFLAGDRASYITGTSIDVSGGMGSYL